MPLPKFKHGVLTPNAKVRVMRGMAVLFIIVAILVMLVVAVVMVRMQMLPC